MVQTLSKKKKRKKKKKKAWHGYDHYFIES